MKGYVALKGDGYYAVTYEGVDQLTGRERRRWHPAGLDLVKGEELAARLASERDRSRGGQRHSLTLGIYLTQRWLPSKRLMLRPTTWDSYRRDIDLHVLPHLGRMPLRHLRPDHLERLYADLLATGHVQRVGDSTQDRP